ncbi:hypothetical protein [Sneathiella limimaris]|uniref:hypothetical protein n=1 Tax=Sneathiella limimaris TaxID=1964213 RepID=UPI00146B935D|nr:hypothetical protein [Sneathiella limimaris]
MQLLKDLGLDVPLCIVFLTTTNKAGTNLHIFIDESGSFVTGTGETSSISTVGALIIPSKSMDDFARLYNRARLKLPKDKGEVKGRLLSERQVGDVANLLYTVGCIFEVVAIDVGLHTLQEVREHRNNQAKAITENLTDAHKPKLKAHVEGLREQLEAMSEQLYVQSTAMNQLIYNTLNHATIYHSFRNPPELASYHWTIDAKSKDGTTSWEDWWSDVVMPMLESRSFKKPFLEIEGGDFSYQKTLPNHHKRTQETVCKKPHERVLL